MKSTEVRELFLNYFKKNGHEIVPSSKVIPENDPTLLFTNAGMNQFKNVFQGLETRSYSKAVSSQKCVRAGGKHNDLENVGHTARHHTFFEMLGNFSFGEYFKREAIEFAWNFATKELGLDKKRLYVSVFTDDDEAADIWIKDQNIPKDHLYRFGEKDNYWRMGDTGPCGPCSEIFYDLGPEVGGDPKSNVMGGEGDRYLEFWNLVFMQFLESAAGKTPLPNPSIDTGAGLERICAILQGQLSNYHTDLFLPIMEKAGQFSNTEYVMDLNKISAAHRGATDKTNVALRVLADHARAATFILADGVLPSNDGRGYVLRRIIRRAIRYGRNLTQDNGLFPATVEKVIETMSGHFTELKEQSQFLINTVKDEEERFLKTLDQGLRIFEDTTEKMASSQKLINGETVFKLYDTYGFPLDLTRVLAQEKGLIISEEDFTKRMQAAKQMAKASWTGKSIDGLEEQMVKLASEVSKNQGSTVFKGYDHLTIEGEKVIGFDDPLMVFKNTPFYSEGGGQTGDGGMIHGPTGLAEVIDCQKRNDIIFHIVKIKEGTFKKGDSCTLKVGPQIRSQIAANHSATHLMHAALIKTLGDHVSQAGSVVEPHRLRFDFTHNKPLTQEETDQIQVLVNSEIEKALPVTTESMSPDEAKAKGALALFGEKYGDQVRVIQMGDFSTELCGGTHVSNTQDVRMFIITTEGGVSSGVRRIEAITGDMASQVALKNSREYLELREHMGLKETWQKSLERCENDTVVWVEEQREKIKALSKQVQKAKAGSIDADEIFKSAADFENSGGKGKVIFADVEIDDRKVLSELSDKLRDKVGRGVVVILGIGEKSNPLIVSVSKDLTKELNAGNILKELAQSMGGKGGGRPDFAQGAVPQREKVGEAKQKLASLLGSKGVH